MPKQKPVLPALAVFVGDLHCGGDTGLALPGFKIPSKQARPYSASTDQQWLYECWRDFNKQIKSRATGHRLFVGFGGDMVDGVAHHGTTQTSGTYSDQVLMAAELVKPLVGMADDALGITGTAAHVGDVGENDAALYESMHIDSAAFYNVKIGGKRLWWSHHGVPVGAREWTKENGAVTLARDVADYCRNEGIDKPDAIIGHDRHKTFEPVTVRGITIGLTPCWQLPTYYGYHWPFKSVTIGALLWYPEAGRMEIIKYAQAQHERIAFSASRNAKSTRMVGAGR
jgi:hypothetical protein